MARPSTAVEFGAALRQGRAGISATDAVEIQGAYGRIAAVQRGTLSESAFAVLREAILSGRLFSGQRLVETTLARELGISRGPLREALQLLQRDGLVDTVPRRGRFVLAFTEAAVTDFYDLRRVLEAYAVERIVASLDEAKEKRLRETAKQVEFAIEQGIDKITPDVTFHELLYELAEQPLLLRIWKENMASKLRFLVHITVPLDFQPHAPATNHVDLVEAICERDLEHAQRLVAGHIDDARERALAAVRETARRREPQSA